MKKNMKKVIIFILLSSFQLDSNVAVVQNNSFALYDNDKDVEIVEPMYIDNVGKKNENIAVKTHEMIQQPSLNDFLIKKYQKIIAGWDVTHWPANIIQNDDLHKFADLLDQDALEPQQAISILQQLMQINNKNLDVQHALIMIMDVFLKKIMQVQGLITSKQDKPAEKTFHDYLYSKEATSPELVAEFNADRLIEESYVTPAMQLSIFTLFKKPFVVNKITAAPYFGEKQNMPTIEKIIDEIDLFNLSSESKANAISALEYANAAINIAIVVAALEASYDVNNQDYYWYQVADKELTKLLNLKKERVQIAMGRLKKADITQKYQPFVYEVQQMADPDLIMLSEDDILNIIKNDAHDFKDPLKADIVANLLFKQCCAAQQHHLKDKALFDVINSRKKNITSDNYIFTNFPTMNEFIEIIRKVKPSSKQHILFTHIRQALQTALFIAQQNSTYYITADPLIEKIKSMDVHIRKYCVDPLYGARQEDINRDAMKSVLMNIAILGVSTVAATASYYTYKGFENDIKDLIDYGIQKFEKYKNIADKIEEKYDAITDFSTWASLTFNVSSGIDNVEEERKKLFTGLDYA